MEKNKKKIIVVSVIALAVIALVAIGSYLYLGTVSNKEGTESSTTQEENNYTDYEATATDKKEESIKKLPPRTDLSEEEVKELSEGSTATDGFVAPPKYE